MVTKLFSNEYMLVLLSVEWLPNNGGLFDVDCEQPTHHRLSAALKPGKLN